MIKWSKSQIPPALAFTFGEIASLCCNACAGILNKRLHPFHYSCFLNTFFKQQYLKTIIPPALSHIAMWEKYKNFNNKAPYLFILFWFARTINTTAYPVFSPAPCLTQRRTPEGLEAS